tara:strand:- start:42 stop:440 length:399 start_codon:yes stop_codon:yes gene_type:complete
MRKIIKGDVNLGDLHLTELFDLSDVEVTGTFRCNNNFLTNLTGSPHTTSNSFSCDGNKLINLIGAPKTVGGFFSCVGNNLTSLKGIPERIGYETSKLIFSSHFYLSANLKDIFSEKYIRSLSDIKGRVVYWR